MPVVPKDCRTNTHHGFTLVELLVVLSIVAVLVALILPAVQASRESARRLACSNNLKQIGLALQAYHDGHRQLPPGGIALGDCCLRPHLITWTISILPYVEQQGLYDQYQQTLPNEHPANRQVVQTLVPIYSCPSDVGTTDLEQPESGLGALKAWAPGSYRAVSGASIGVNGDWYFDNSSVPDQMPRGWRGAMHVTRRSKRLSTERFGNIIDGTANTMVVGEYHTRSHNRRRTFWAYAYNSFNQSSVQRQRRTLIPDYDACVSQGGAGGDNPCKRAFASFHRKGMNGLFADGSVRPINLPEIDMSAWWAIGTIAGGEPVNEL
ncbi:MAG: DUF1559 domain-containing protein [Planctomycetota bacterium]|nr:DUF1559 domain-containing protein [Planctomycetota bacterium]